MANISKPTDKWEHTTDGKFKIILDSSEEAKQLILQVVSWCLETLGLFGYTANDIHHQDTRSTLMVINNQLRTSSSTTLHTRAIEFEVSTGSYADQLSFKLRWM